VEGVGVRVGPSLGLELGGPATDVRRLDRSQRHRAEVLLDDLQVHLRLPHGGLAPGAVAVEPLVAPLPTVSLATFGATWSPRTTEAIASLSHFCSSTFRSKWRVCSLPALSTYRARHRVTRPAMADGISIVFPYLSFPRLRQRSSTDPRWLPGRFPRPGSLVLMLTS
jgi:hypothetical protein